MQKMMSIVPRLKATSATSSMKNNPTMSVFAVMPIGLALNTMQKAGKSDSEKMDSKEYSKQIDSRIAEIKSECGL